MRAGAAEEDAPQGARAPHAPPLKRTAATGPVAPRLRAVRDVPVPFTRTLVGPELVLTGGAAAGPVHAPPLAGLVATTESPARRP